ncbi:MAG: AAA family ATPase [Solirubrobacterales bacterium]|nr:AAA family ATPase [Solirubrobacterales bacterium]
MRAREDVRGLGVPAFVGRERERVRLGALAEQVAAGHGQVVVVGGEAGIGKSRVAEWVSAECARREFVVLSGVADEVERRRPFGVVLDAVARYDARFTARGMTGVLDGEVLGRAAGGFGSEARISEALVGIVEGACGDGPVAVMLDDLQWADESSLVAVNALARLASSHPLLLVCVLRPYPVGGPLRALLAALDYRRAVRIELGGLGADEIDELAAGLARAPLGKSVRRALEQAGGNPFYASALLACLLTEGAAGVSGEGLLEVTGAVHAPSLGLTILEQLRFLPETTLEVLRAAAVVGRAFSLADVALISPSTVSDVAAALGPAQAAAVVVADGPRLRFRHDLIREAIYEDLAPAVRMSLHRYLASRLFESGAGLERVGAQLILGAAPGDMEAVGWLRRAGREASASSPAIAAQLLWRALELAGEAGSVRLGLLGDIVRPLLWTGQAARAEQVCAEGVTAPDASEAPVFWLGLADSRLLQGRFRDARETCGQALVGCAHLDASDRLHLRAVQALSGVYLGEGVAPAREIVATAPISRSRGVAQEAIAQWELFRGRADRALAAYEQVDSMRTPAALGNRIWGASGIRVRMWEALTLIDLDRLQEAGELLEREIAAKLAVPGLPHAFLAACHYHAGRFDEALRECGAATAAAQAAGSFLPASAPALAATIALRQGRLEDAERLTLEAERVRGPVEAAGDTIARWARTLLLEATGNLEPAADAAGGALEAYERAGFASYLAWHAPDLVRVALHAGRIEQARRAVEAAERAASQLPVASRRAGALRARGLITGDPSALLRALAASREVPRPIDLAMSLRDTAAALACTGDQAQARLLAAEALELLRELGATGDERNARQLLRAAGLTFGARAKHTRARHGWDSLTPGELRVVALAAEGRSNPEIAQLLFVSRRTVAWHLYNVFRKLGVSSRVQLVTEALRRERG